MKVIDFRVRPPFGSYLTCGLYDVNIAQAWTKRLQVSIADSMINKSMEMCIQEMDNANVVKGVVPVRKSSGGNNTDFTALAEQYPNRFIGFAGIDPLVDDYNFEIENNIINGSFSGVIMEPGYCKKPLYADNEVFFPIYEKCQENNIPILLSFGGLIGPNHSYSKPIYIDNIAATFPKLKIVIGHAAWPFATEMAHVAFCKENVYMSPDIYLINAPGFKTYIDAANFLYDKVIFASAYPGVPMQEAINFYKTCGIKEEYHQYIFYKNAAKVLGIE